MITDNAVSYPTSSVTMAFVPKGQSVKGESSGGPLGLPQDAILGVLLPSSLVKLTKLFKVTDLIGVTDGRNTGGVDTSFLMGLKPEKERYSYVADAERYGGNRFFRIADAVSDLRNRKRRGRSSYFTHENQVMHLSFNGSVVSCDTPIDLFPWNELVPFMGYGLPGFADTTPLAYTQLTGTFEGFGDGVLPQYSYVAEHSDPPNFIAPDIAVKYDFVACLHRLAEILVNGETITRSAGHMTGTISGPLQTRIDDEGTLWLTYNMCVTHDGISYVDDFRTTYNVCTTFRASITDSLVQRHHRVGTYDVSSTYPTLKCACFGLEVLHERKAESGVWVPSDDGPGDHFSELLIEGSWTIACEPTDEKGLPEMGSTPLIRFLSDPRPYNWSEMGERDGATRADALVGCCEVLLEELRPAAFYASADAVDNFFGLIRANHLETLKDLGNLAAYIPRTKRLLAFYKALRQGRFLSAGRDLLHTLADSKLLYQFGYAPTVNDAIELANKAAPIIETLKNLRDTNSVLYGSRTWELPEGTIHGVEGLRLTVHSKLRIRVDDSSLLTAVLKADAVGLLPRLSRLWNLVPFSFIVDWFFNMDDRLSAVDSQAMMFAITVDYCVHSYHLSGRFADTELARYGLAHANLVSDGGAGFTFYKREKTRFTPGLFESRFDFVMGGSVPDMGTVAALLYKQLT